MDARYSILGAESYVQSMKDHNKEFATRVLSQLSGDDLTYDKVIHSYVNTYIKQIENKIEKAKLDTKIDL